VLEILDDQPMDQTASLSGAWRAPPKTATTNRGRNNMRGIAAPPPNESPCGETRLTEGVIRRVVIALLGAG
jgi:hypothetical protein